MLGRNRVKIDGELLERARKYSRIAGYASVEEFVAHVLKKELDKLGGDGETEEEIRKRMQGLGYIS